MSEITGEVAMRDYEHSNSLNEFAAALAKAQGAMGHARKDSENPHFRSKYADLASVWDACRPALSSNGIAVVQMPGLTPSGDLELTTQLIHSSGQWMRSTLAAKPAKCDPQGIGSATTYLRRYGLSAMVGVAPEEDDGEGAAGRGQANGNDHISAPPSSKPAPRTAAPRQSANAEDQAFRQLANDILAAIKACETQDSLNTLLKVRADDLASVKKASQTAYEALMENATKRDTQLANGTILDAA